MEEIITDLKNKNMITSDAATVLDDNFSGLTYEIIKSHFKNQNIMPKGHRYTDEVKKFALTLHFYSPLAYNFVRPLLSLPAPSSIANWTSSVQCEPGFFKDVFSYLKETAGSDVNYKECALIIDAMAIKTSIINDKTTGRFIGFNDFGENNVECDPEIPDTEALVFMIVGLRGQ